MEERADYLTDEGRKRLEEELHYLRTKRRSEVAARIREAKREGDVMDNAGYEAAKHEQAFIEGRIKELEALLKRAVRIDGKESAGKDIVTLGCRVTIREDGCQPETYKIVGSMEADPTTGSISNECPLGQALLGRRVGDRVIVKAPSGLLTVQITAIE